MNESQNFNGCITTRIIVSFSSKNTNIIVCIHVM